MAGSLVQTPVNGAADWSDFIFQMERVKKGFNNIAFTTLTEGSTAPEISAGSWIELDGNIFKFTSQEAATGWGGIGTDNFVYMKVVPSGTSITAAFTTSVPTYNYLKKGWYDGDDRYILWLYKDSGNNYVDMRTTAERVYNAEIFSDGFETGTTGNLPDDPGGAGTSWADTSSSGTYNAEVSTTQKAGGAKSFWFFNDDSPNDIEITAEFYTSTAQYFVLDYYAYIDSTPWLQGGLISLLDIDGNEACKLSFGDVANNFGAGEDQIMQYWSDNTEISTGWTFPQDEWLHFRIVLDQVNKTYSVTGNGENIVLGDNYESTSTAYVTKMVIFHVSSQPNIYFDSFLMWESDKRIT